MAKKGEKHMYKVMNEKPKFLLRHGRFGFQFFNGTKTEQGLRQALGNAIANANNLMENGTEEEYENAIVEAEKAKEMLNKFLRVEGLTPDPVNIVQTIEQPKTEPTNAEKAEKYRAAFMNALKGKTLSEQQAAVMKEFKAAMTEGTNADGGFIVPEDISTTINKLKLTVDALEQYVNVQPVSTNKGQRTLEVRADSTPFATLAEMGNIQATDQPQFQRMSFAIEDYAGFMAISNDLLADTDQALLAYLTEWFAKKSKATRNALILTELAKLTKVAFTDYKAIKKALNVTLDPAISANSSIITNQDGFQFLDVLDDGTGRPLLQPDPTKPTQHTLFGRPLIVLANKTIPTVSNKAPVIVGDLKEAVILWDRKQMSLDMTNIGGNAWRTNSTELRAIEREDVTLWDSAAVVYGQLTVS